MTMEKKPTLVVLAAGMGSRFGGIKQLTPVGKNGELIIDYSIYDAARAGFGRVVFVITRRIEQAFRETIGVRAEKLLPVDYAFQALDDLPEGFTLPEGREKPWGTGHAVAAARDLIDGPFAVINADDFYGAESFRLLAGFLTAAPAAAKKPGIAMVGFKLENTLTESGTVSRGVCEIGEAGRLLSITERTKIKKCPEGAAFTEDDGENWTPLAADTTVSMNCWAFPAWTMAPIVAGFRDFLAAGGVNGLKTEYYLPGAVDMMIRQNGAEVTVLKTDEKWYGMTYADDRQMVQDAVAAMVAAGKYPEKL